MFAVILVLTPAFAQKVPPASRTVYKCESEGKVIYADSPCLGARKVDVEPTRGLNRSTGAERVGADVRKERQNEQVAQALKPIFNETAEQRVKRHHRAKLKPDVRSRCGRLDDRIAEAEDNERKTTGSELPAAQKDLFNLRVEYRNLQC